MKKLLKTLCKVCFVALLAFNLLLSFANVQAYIATTNYLGMGRLAQGVNRGVALIDGNNSAAIYVDNMLDVPALALKSKDAFLGFTVIQGRPRMILTSGSQVMNIDLMLMIDSIKASEAKRSTKNKTKTKPRRPPSGRLPTQTHKVVSR